MTCWREVISLFRHLHNDAYVNVFNLLLNILRRKEQMYFYCLLLYLLCQKTTYAAGLFTAIKPR